MNPSEYVADLHHFLQAHPAIASFHLATDYRGERFLYLSGKVEFAHGGTLDLKEFLEFHANRVERYHYAYNYRMSETVRFRYDNAPDPRAKHLSTYPSPQTNNMKARPWWPRLFRTWRPSSPKFSAMRPKNHREGRILLLGSPGNCMRVPSPTAR